MPRASKKSEEKEEKEAKAFAEKLRERVNGITCADCDQVNWFPYATWGKCHKHTSITGEFLEVSKNGVACKHHPRLRESNSGNRS